MMRKIIISLVIISLSFFPFGSIFTTEAAVSSWQKGINISPNSTTDFAGDSFKQSLRNARSLGVTNVSLIIPYYQSNIFSTDLAPGWNTPTDQALAAAIDYAHSLGMKVMLTPHAETYGNDWRAQINPGDRNGWFNAYGNILLHLGQLGQQHGVEFFSLGTELVNMSVRYNPGNTAHWTSLISQVRNVFHGQLTYGANSTNNNDDGFQNEKKFIDFWPQLDFVGLSAYYGLNSPGNSVDELKGQWDYWNNSDIKGFAASVGKPVVFTEIGYRSVSGAHYAPWDWGRGGGADQAEQANDYQALFEYWNNYNYMTGVYLWDWQVNPNAGGAGDVSFTPQNKTAQGVMQQWFGNSPPPSDGGGPAAAFSTDGSATPSSPSAGQSVTATVNIKNSGGSGSNLLVDLEVYDETNARITQQFVEGQSFAAGVTKSYNVTWTAQSGTQKKYRVSTGVFTAGWAKNLYWNSEVVTVMPQTGPGGGNPGPASTNIWWPTNGAIVTGTQPFKAMVENRSIDSYRMYWRVGDGVLNPMYDSTADYPHKEAWVDVSGWHWEPSGNYNLTFVSKDMSTDATISSASITIHVP